MDLGRPYYNCYDAGRRPPLLRLRFFQSTNLCYRPTVCREYSCANDPRIWTDFDAMVLNDEWIAQHTGPDVPGPIEAFMHASLEPRTWPASRSR